MDIETPAPDDLLALNRQLCFALAIASRSVISTYTPILKPMGLTHPQYLVMLALWESQPLSLTDLAELLRLELGTLSPLVKRLETAGLVTRARSVDDERQLEVRLTPDGQRLRSQAERVPPQVFAALGVDLDELADLHSRLTAIIDQIAPHASSNAKQPSGE